MVTRLPIVEIEGKRYYEDERLREYREVMNPHKRIGFDEVGERKVKVLQEREELTMKNQRRKRGQRL